MTDRTPIPITRPWLGEEELRAVQEPLRSGWLVQGPRVAAFEDRFRRYVGAAAALATTSCTTALHLAMAALDLQPGDEVLVPAFTWVATANVVEYMGATPVFVDIDLATFNVDAAQLEAHVTPRTVGMIPVHLFGLSADMDPIIAVAQRHALWIVEDAACGFGARYRERHVGTFGEMGCFSFHPRKSITTGEGGMVTTGDTALAAAIRSLRDHGASRSDLQRHTEGAGFLLAAYDRLGYNYRMTDLQGAIGEVQMDRADWILAERRRVAAAYDERLAGRDWLALPATPPGYTHGYQSYVCLVRPEQPRIDTAGRVSAWRNSLMAELERRGIATRQGTHAPFLQGFYARRYAIPPDQLPNAYFADRLSVSLPLFPGMTEAEIDRVCESLIEVGESTQAVTTS